MQKPFRDCSRQQAETSLLKTQDTKEVTKKKAKSTFHLWIF